LSQELLIDAAVGETRSALIEEGRVSEIHLERWSEAGQFAAAGVVYRARVSKVDPARGGAFVDLGVGPAGWMPVDSGVRLTEGAAVIARVRAEAHHEKGSLMRFEAAAEPGAPAPELISVEGAWGAHFEESGVEIRQAEIADRQIIDEALESALSYQAAIPGGGALWIEPTRALTAIDVDTGGRTLKGGEKGMRAFLDDAIAEAARQTRLRGLGGLIAMDLPHVTRARRKEIEQAVQRAFADPARQVEFTNLSRFGLIQIARERIQRPLAATCLDDQGRVSVETAALSALRKLEGEGASDRAARLTLQVSASVKAWLDADPIGWRTAMTERIGARFTVAADPALRRTQAEVSRV